MTDFLKTLFLFNGILATTFGVFVQICHICSEVEVSPWLSVPATWAVCAFVYVKTARAAIRRFG